VNILCYLLLFYQCSCIALLLYKDLEAKNETTAIAMQRRGKHASITIELLLETAFSNRFMQCCYKKDNLGDLVSCQLELSSVLEAVQIGPEGG
jgi:hypothetical protein